MAAEKNFENRIKNYLDKKGAWYIKFFANAFTKSGIPDILCCVNGRFVGIEVKQETGVVSPLQEFHLQDITSKGGLGILVYPSGFDELKNILDEIILNNTYDGKEYLNEKGYLLCKRGV